MEGDPVEAFRRGKLTLILHGEKLRGEFHFVRTKRNQGRDWLLFKGTDEFAAPGYAPGGTRSVKSGRAIEEIRAEQDARWTPAVVAPAIPAPRGTALPSPPPPSPRRAPPPRAPRKPPPDPFPEPFRPMLAQTAEGSFSRAGWFFEIKWDGVRALAFVRRHGATQEIALYSRTLHRLNAQFPDVVASLAALEAD